MWFIEFLMIGDFSILNLLEHYVHVEVLDDYIIGGIILLCLSLLIFTSISAELILFGGLSLLILLGIMPVEIALSGFSNQGLITIAALYIVAAGLKETGAIQYILQNIMGTTSSVRKAQLRIMTPVMIMSAFFNNTPIVATFIPALEKWAQKAGISVSKLLIPLSYAAILGGTCTLIGTSTNLIINGMLIEETGGPGLGFFEPAWIGLPISIAGFIYLYLFGDILIPDRKSGFQSFKNTREYTIEMIVDKGSSLVAKTIEDAGLRSLPGLYLAEIIRDGRSFPAVGPREQLREQDRLIFTGITESIVDLQQINGLSLATDQIFKLDAPRNERKLFEAVVSASNPIVGRSIKEGQFRNRYNAVVLAVSRSGERLNEKIGDIQLKTGDILLVEASTIFNNRFKNSSDFYLMSSIAGSTPLSFEKSWLSISLVIGMVICISSGVLSLVQASLLVAFLMIVFKCCHYATALEYIDWKVLIFLGAALGLGSAIEYSGVADSIARTLFSLSGNDILLALIITYIVTWLLTELITNAAAAVLLFPIIISTSISVGGEIIPFIIVMLIAASASLSTPIGYQTNLMVFNAGGYKYVDFLKVGLPLNIIVGIITILLVPLIWSI